MKSKPQPRFASSEAKAGKLPSAGSTRGWGAEPLLRSVSVLRFVASDSHIMLHSDHEQSPEDVLRWTCGDEQASD